MMKMIGWTAVIIFVAYGLATFVRTGNDLNQTKYEISKKSIEVAYAAGQKMRDGDRYLEDKLDPAFPIVGEAGRWVKRSLQDIQAQRERNGVLKELDKQFGVGEKKVQKPTTMVKK